MEMPTDEMLAAMRGNEFVAKALESIRSLIYVHFRDWDRIGRSGRIPFTEENAKTAYDVLSYLLGTVEVPDVGDGKVRIGGGPQLSMKSIEMLQAAFAKPEPATH